MKIYCEKCKQEITKETSKQFENFEVGQVVCHNCKTKQKRYLSEADILLYFGMSTIIYVLTFVFIIMLYGFYSINISVVIGICLLFVIAYIALKYTTSMIYTKAYFKQDLKYKVMTENKDLIAKRMKWQLIMFMLIAFMFGSNPEYFPVFIVLIVAFLIIILIKFRLQVRNEREK